MRRTAILAILAMVAAMLAVSSPLSAAEPERISDADRYSRVGGAAASDFRFRSPDDIVQVFIQFDAAAVAEVAADGATGAAQRAQSQRVRAQQAQMRNTLSDVIVEELSDMQVAANGLRVKVRAGDIPAIRATAGVVSVAGVTRYYPSADTIDTFESIPWIGGDVVEDAGYSGEDITIAIIDTGIDYTHWAFGGAATVEAYEANDPEIIEEDSFPTWKVIGGYDFAGTAYDASDPDLDTPTPDPDPLDVHGHGTHVAATAAGFGNVNFFHGMAQGASLFAFKVFGDDAGSTDLVADALERAMDPNDDGDTSDHVDVVNMSLGSDYGSPDDPSSIASGNAVALGIVVVAASGNAGNSPYITGSPAVNDATISVAASIDDGYFLNALQVNSPAGIAGDYQAAIGDFGSVADDVTGDLVATEPFDACAPLTNGAAVSGNIAFLTRGTCDFTVKLLNAQDAGAVAAVVVNNVAGAPINMGQNGDPTQPSIPGMMILQSDGGDIADAMESDTVNVTLSDDVTIPQPELADMMTDFTSRGPGIDNTFKPDISAPGFGIVSADVGSGDGGASSNGTSMASPHIAGMAAQMLSKYADLEPAAVKALIMNSARPATPDGGVPLARQGTGVGQADVAILDLEGYATPGGVSFGRINPTDPGDATETVTVTRLDGNGDAEYNVSFMPNMELDGVAFSVPSVVTTSGGTADFDIELSWDPASMDPDDALQSQSEADGWVVLENTSNPDDTMVVGVIAVLDPASEVSATGGEAEFTLLNGGNADGPAWGFTQVSDEDGGWVNSIGFQTFDFGDTGIDFALTTDGYVSPNLYEVDIWIDVDGDGLDDYLGVGIDQGIVTGTGEFNGVYLTALFDLNLGGGTLQWLANADFNDNVLTLPFDLTGGLGFNPPSDTFDIDVLVWDLRDDALVSIAEDMTVDLGSEITSPAGLTFNVPAGDGGTIPADGAGEMLWLFPNNQVGAQSQTTSIDEPPAPIGKGNVATVVSASSLWEMWEDGVKTDSFVFGRPGDLPFMGDWDGDGVATPGLYRQSDGFVYLRNSNTAGWADVSYFFGRSGDIPVVGDFDGDGDDTVSVYRPSTAKFYIQNELKAGFAEYEFVFGRAGDVPVAGDWDSDGTDTVGLRRATNGFVYLTNTNEAGWADVEFFYGRAGDLVFSGDWDGDGSDSIGLYRPSNGMIYLRNALTSGNADSEFHVGPGRMPAGDF